MHFLTWNFLTKKFLWKFDFLDFFVLKNWLLKIWPGPVVHMVVIHGIWTTYKSTKKSKIIFHRIVVISGRKVAFSWKWRTKTPFLTGSGLLYIIWPPKLFCLYAELHAILNPRNFNYRRKYLVNLKITKLSLLFKPIQKLTFLNISN